MKSIRSIKSFALFFSLACSYSLAISPLSASQDTELHNAARDGNLDKVKALVIQEVNLDAKGTNDNTPLHYASEKGHIEIVKHLVENGASITAKNNAAKVPSEVACQGVESKNNQQPIQSFLSEEVKLRKKLGINVIRKNFSSLAEAQNEKIASLTKSNEALQKQLEMTMKRLSTLQDIHEKFVQKQTKNMEKLAFDQSERIKDIHDIHDKKMKTYFNKKMVEKYSASLVSAARKGNPDQVKESLMQGADVNVQDSKGITPLHLAVQGMHVKVVEMLIFYKANLELSDYNGATPLHYAAERESFAPEESMIYDEAQENEGNSYIDEEVENASLTIVRNLCSNGASLIAQTLDGDTPLHIAAKVGNLSIVKILIREGANLATKNKGGKVPLDLIPNATPKQDKQEAPIKEFFKETTKQLSVKLSKAASAGDLDTIQRCLSRGAPIDTQDANNATPLHKAAAGGHFEVVLFFAQKGLSLILKEKNGKTPAAYLSSKQCIEIVHQLFFVPEHYDYYPQNLDLLHNLYAILPQNSVEERFAELYKKLPYKVLVSDIKSYSPKVELWPLPINVLGDYDEGVEKLYELKECFESQRLDDDAFKAYLQVLLNIKRCNHRTKDCTTDTIISCWLAGTGIVLAQKIIKLIKQFQY